MEKDKVSDFIKNAGLIVLTALAQMLFTFNTVTENVDELKTEFKELRERVRSVEIEQAKSSS